MALKESSEPIGICGILNRAELETPDIGYALLPVYQGQGYAQEVVSATLQFAKESLKIPVISAIVQPDNLRSIALLRSNGFKFIKLFSFPDKTEVLELYQTG